MFIIRRMEGLEIACQNHSLYETNVFGKNSGFLANSFENYAFEIGPTNSRVLGSLVGRDIPSKCDHHIADSI